MSQQCYVLYSNDGSYPPLISNYSGLSAYTSSFVNIDIGLTAITGTSFYVYDLGNVTACTPTYTGLTVSSTATTDCECYFIKIPQELFDTTYVDCNDVLVVDQFSTGQTTNICSKIYPYFDTMTTIPVVNKGVCVGGQCPNTLITTPVGKNECDVITIFPMEVECIINHPSSDLVNDGSTTLSISGGTPPYSVNWAVGSLAPALINIGIGSYEATVIDYYGDFTANTTCVLTAVTTVFSAMCFYVSGQSTNFQPVYITAQPSGIKNGKPNYQLTYLANVVGFVYWDGATNTWLFCEQLDCQNGLFYGSLDNPGTYPFATGGTYNWTAGTSNLNSMITSVTGPCVPPVPVITYPSLCLNYLLEIPDPVTNISTYETITVDLLYSGITNGQPYWESSGGGYEIFWQTGSTPNRWFMTGFTGNTISVVNNNPAAPPLTGWQVLGTPFITNLTVTQGPCSGSITLQLLYTKTNPTCTNDGSILIQVLNGIPPYQYSIDGGVTFQGSPIFNNLFGGTYNVVVVDSNVGTGQITIQLINGFTTFYNLQLVTNQSAGTLTLTAPTMPPGVSMTFDLVHNSVLNYYPNSVSPIPSYQNVVTLNTVGPMTLFSQNNSFTFLSGPCTQVYNPLIQNQIYKIYKNTITMTSGQVITGTITNSVLNNLVGNCKSSVGSYNIQVTNISMNGCTCCGGLLVNTPQQNLPVS